MSSTYFNVFCLYCLLLKKASFPGQASYDADQLRQPTYRLILYLQQDVQYYTYKVDAMMIKHCSDVTLWTDKRDGSSPKSETYVQAEIGQAHASCITSLAPLLGLSRMRLSAESCSWPTGSRTKLLQPTKNLPAADL